MTSLNINAKAAAAFLEQSAEHMHALQQAQDLFLTLPAEAVKSIFKLSAFQTPHVLLTEQKTTVRKSLWDTFLSPLFRRCDVTNGNLNQIDDLKETADFTADNLARFKSLIDNELSIADVLGVALKEFKAESFKGANRIAAAYQRYYLHEEAFMIDLMVAVAQLAGASLEVEQIKQQLKSLNAGNSISFDSLGITVALAKNENLTVKMEKATVDLLNKALSV